MSEPNFVVLYVEDLPRSSKLYSCLLGLSPKQLSPGFAMFQLDSGFNIGLWSGHSIDPSVNMGGGSAEVVIPAPSSVEVDNTCRGWRDLGLEIQQQPMQLGFGYSFVAADPDGHRIRVLADSGT